MNADDEVSSSENSISSDTDCDGQCDYYKTLCKANGLCVLTKEETFILDIIDQISDQDKRRKALQKYMDNYNPKRIKIEEPKPEAYSLKEIIGRVKNSNKEKEVSQNDLAQEIKTLKRELTDLKNRVSILELSQQNKSDSDSEREEAETSENTKDNSESLVFVNMINRVITHKWYIQVTIIVNKEYMITARAMVDSGTDLNCISEGMIPSRYFSKTSQTLIAANRKRLRVKYKLDNAAICNNGVCLEMPFIMVENLSHDVILGNPFLHMLYPIQSIDEKGIKSFVNSQEITFKFITQPRYHEIDVINKRKVDCRVFLIQAHGIF